ncbi:MAG TPA: gephyrin-like molybdotransferase Glp [Bacteroidales bacterium]|nr:gephyrin-like molybdotransferase Glp [Bacteroidales bacterium]
MTTYQQALDIILGSVNTVGHERIKLEESYGRALAEDVYSDVDMPPFDKAAVDGYACRRSDLGMVLHILEVIAAGQVPSHRIEKGQCTKLMTGAPVPPGADMVIMVELTEKTQPGYIRFAGGESPANIAYKAEDVKIGDLVVKKGVRIMPQQVAVMASVGQVNPLVSKKPRVGILSTGDELVEPNKTPEDGKIRNSNAWQLVAQVLAAGAIPNYMGIVPDEEHAMNKAVGMALEQNNLVVITGGVSMGDYDIVPEIMRRNKVEILFEKVAVKPGRPTVFGRAGNCSIFGLPGNPVSTFINFEVFVKPLIFGMMGLAWQYLECELPLETDFLRKKADRLEFLPVKINSSGKVDLVSYHGSAHIHSLCQANALMTIPVGKTGIKKGELVNVRPL